MTRASTSWTPARGPRLDQNPALIMQMTPSPQTLLNPATFPVDPTSCRPIYPHSYLKVNTIFEVAKAAGLRTARSDKHPVYESFNGPSGTGIDDFFAPEIDSTAIEPDGTPYPGDISWTGDNAATRQYDGYKVQAIINEIGGEIGGYDHSGTRRVGTPAIFGMNSQTVLGRDDDRGLATASRRLTRPRSSGSRTARSSTRSTRRGPAPIRAPAT